MQLLAWEATQRQWDSVVDECIAGWIAVVVSGVGLAAFFIALQHHPARQNWPSLRYFALPLFSKAKKRLLCPPYDAFSCTSTP